MDDYLEVLDNPFTDTTAKRNDGLVSESCALKLRTQGTFHQGINSGYTSMIYIVPAVSNTISFIDRETYPVQSNPLETIPQDHCNAAGTVVNNTLYHRLISTAVRFRLVNDEYSRSDDGTWEAIRVPIRGISGLDFGMDNSQWRPNNQLWGSIADYPSYQTGLLKDIDEYTFQLNTENNTHFFDSNTLKQGFDMIAIRINGRRYAPNTKLYWKAISNQEVVYNTGTKLSKFHTPCYLNENTNQATVETRRKYPATYTGKENF